MNIDICSVNHKQKNTVISALEIVRRIKREYKGVDLIIFGNPEILLDIQFDKKVNKAIELIKVFLVCAILFLGTGLAIINFHEDVNMRESLIAINYLVTGIEDNEPLSLYATYSIGIGTGMAIFFSHFMKRKWKKEPSPLEVELYMYEKNIDEYILDKTKHTSNE